MKVSSISYLNNYTKTMNRPSFKHTAVPYPEYEAGYSFDKKNAVPKKITNMIEKLTVLFRPEVTNEAEKIKSQIDGIYDSKSAKKQLMSILA